MGAPKISVVRRDGLMGEKLNEHPYKQGNKEEVIAFVRVWLEGLLKMMVNDEDDISVSVMQGERTTIFNVSCGRNSLPMVLGRQGRTITSIRNIVASATGRYGYRSIVEVPYYPPASGGR